MNNELIKFLNDNFYNVEVVNRKSYNVFNFGKRIKNKYSDNKYEYFINNFGNSYIFCAQKDCVNINIDNKNFKMVDAETGEILSYLSKNKEE